MDAMKDELIRSLEFGQYLLGLRNEKSVSLATMGAAIGVSANYLSEIERGRKTPSDNLLRDLAKYFDVCEDDLFRRLGRIPLAAVDELNRNSVLQEILSDINRNQKLNPNDRQRLYDQIKHTYEDFIRREGD